jgi:hypothetical protein
VAVGGVGAFAPVRMWLVDYLDFYLLLCLVCYGQFSGSLLIYCFRGMSCGGMLHVWRVMSLVGYNWRCVSTSPGEHGGSGVRWPHFIILFVYLQYGQSRHNYFI